MSAILVVRPSSLGDVVHALALVADVRRARPELAVDWVAEDAFVDLPKLCPDVRHVHPLALRRWRHRPLKAATWREFAALHGALGAETYAAILNLQEQVKGGVVARMARGPRHGFDRSSIREPIATLLDNVHHRVPRDRHFLERCRALAAAALGYGVEGSPRWSWQVPATAAALPESPYIVALHATSRASKLWPEDRWRALLASFAAVRFGILLPFGSDPEAARSNRLAADIDGAVVPPRQTLPELATLLSRAELVVGVDTGLTHFAAALGTPTVALFTETDPADAGVAIAGTHARDLGGNGIVPSLDAVLAATGALLRRGPSC